MSLLRAIYRPAGNNRGFTIVELLVAVVILTFVSIALMQTAMVNIEFNTKNSIRDEGVRLAGEKLDFLRTVAISNLDSYKGTVETDDRRVRNMQVPYTSIMNVTTVGENARKLDVMVSWGWKDEIFNTSVSTVRGE